MFKKLIPIILIITTISTTSSPMLKKAFSTFIKPKILKLGGSVITYKNSCKPYANNLIIDEISHEISKYKKPLILVHGTGSFGHPQVKKYDLETNFCAKGIMETINSERYLNRKIVKSLNEFRVKAITVDTPSFLICENGRIKSMNLDAIKIMLENGFMPVLFGTIVMDKEKKYCLLSSDQITPYLAKHFGVSTIGIGSAEDGVYDGDGDTIDEIHAENFDYFEKFIGESEAIDTTGGMRGKVKELLAIPGMTSYIFNASKKENIRAFLRGKKVGTKITS